jgi:hypothetical protein
MALSLKTPSAGRGALWVREGFRLFGRKPLAFSGMFAAFLFVALVVAFLPFVGPLLQMALLPLLSLGFMVASLAALKGEPVQPGQFFEPFQADPARTRALIGLCVAYGLAAIGLLLLCNWISDGKLEQLQALWAAGEERREERDALAADRDVFVGTVVGILGVPLLSIPFWHAPALIYWGGQGVAQALFSSTLAVWRCRGAFLVYAVAGGALAIGALMVVSLAAGLIGAPSLVAVLAVPVALSMTSVFYLSVLFSFNDSFGGKAVPPMDDDYTRTDPG